MSTCDLEMKVLSKLLIVTALSALSALAADVNGTWSGVVPLPTGQQFPFIAHLTQAGDKITGKLDGINGAPDVKILNGKIQGDTVTFQGVRKINGEDEKFNYTTRNRGPAFSP